jgi:hypothetical protein
MMQAKEEGIQNRPSDDSELKDKRWAVLHAVPQGQPSPALPCSLPKGLLNIGSPYESG